MYHSTCSLLVAAVLVCRSVDAFSSIAPRATPQKTRLHQTATEDVSVCVIGGGVSGLAAAITAAEAFNLKNQRAKVVLLEAEPTLGGPLQSDVTEDGYVLDRFFSVFIEGYPAAKKLLDYEALQLGRFIPGAVVKVKGSISAPATLTLVTNPIFRAGEAVADLPAPVGSLVDKIKYLPLLYHVIRTPTEELFREPETDTLSCLKNRWGFSDGMIDKFFKPYLEGIYLVPLEEQSSRMFHFVFKNVFGGSASLPKGGIGAVPKQLEARARRAGVHIRTRQSVLRILQDGMDGSLVVDVEGYGSNRISAKSVVLATDGRTAQQILSEMEGLESLKSVEEFPQLGVGCLYYGFKSPVPITEPFVFVSGAEEERNTEAKPINNLCFPSVVSEGYAPDGCNLCSVTVLSKTMKAYEGRTKELDSAVRSQLGNFFPDYKGPIYREWELKGVYYVPNARPGQLTSPCPATVNGGRDCTSFLGMKLPEGLVVCGDYMATATLNGALESGINAGEAAFSYNAASTDQKGAEFVSTFG